MVSLFIEGPWCLSLSFWCITWFSEMKCLRTTQFSFYLAHDSVSQLGAFSGLMGPLRCSCQLMGWPHSLMGGSSAPPPAGMAHLFSMWPLILQSPGLLHAVKSKSDAQLVFKSVIVSHLLLSSWQKQLTRPSPESVWEGSTQGQRRKLQWHLCKWFIPRSHCHYGFLGENLLEIAIFWEDPPLIMGPRYTQL